MQRWYHVMITIVALVASAAAAQASGVLLDNGLLTANLDPGTLSNRSCGAAFDGTYYWTAEGGFTSGNTLNQYSASGALLNAFQTGIDHRGIFTTTSGDVIANDYGGGGMQIYQYVNGVPNLLFQLSTVPDSQMECGWRASNGHLYGHAQGTIYEYDFTNGQQLGSLALVGYSASYPANVQLAVVDVGSEYLLTYDDGGNVAAWDFSGVQVGSCLIGLTDFDQKFSFSFANGLLWIETVRNGIWNGYEIFAGPTAVEPTTWGAVKAAYR